MRAVGLCGLVIALGVGATFALTQALAANRPTHGSVEPATGSAHLGYGLNVRDPAHLDTLFAPLGFEWVKLYEQYDALPTTRLPYKVLYRIQLDGPPADLSAWGERVENIARAGKGLVEAYEIGNEPNQSWQWGNDVPDPAEYAAALREAYTRIKAIDPDALVVSGGLGPVGRVQATPAGEGWPGNNGAAMDEHLFAAELFTRCISRCFDVFGYHPFGFAYPPETDPSSVSNNFAFRGAELLRQIMLDHGLGDAPMWATEFGWIRDPAPDGYGWCKQEHLDGFLWMLVNELEQADYLSRALAYADANWPWMEAMFVWNLDWYDQGWDCENIRFFSLRYVDGTAAPAYDALAVMNKRPGPAGCRLWVEPGQFFYLTGVDQPSRITETIALPDLGGCDAITWTAALAPGSTLSPTLALSQGRLGQPLTFTLDTAAFLVSGTGTLRLYPPGAYTTLLTLSTTPSNVIASPQMVRVTLVVAAELYPLFLPLLTNDK